jgi:hypothetical protein
MSTPYFLIVGMTQEEYLEALRSGAQMNFADLIELIDKNYNYTPASFINGDLQNSVTENLGVHHL